MPLSIYNTKSSTKYHYVYQITEKSTNKKYIGCRSTYIEPCLDLGIHYFSSSSNKEFMKSQKENPSDYIYEVLNVFSNRVDATKKESDLHELYDVKNNSGYYNRSNQTSNKFDTSGYVAVKNDDGDTLLVECNDPRYLSGQLVHVSTGLVTVKDENGNISNVNKDDPRYLSGELVSNMLGLFHAKDEFGKTYTISKDDPRYLSGELVGMTKGVKLSDEIRMKRSINASKPMLGKKHKKESIDIMKDKKKGDNNPRARSISIDGIVYTTILEASKVHNTYPHTVRRRLNSNNDKWESWFYL